MTIGSLANVTDRTKGTVVEQALSGSQELLTLHF